MIDTAELAWIALAVWDIAATHILWFLSLVTVLIIARKYLKGLF